MNNIISRLCFLALCTAIFVVPTYACSLAPDHLGTSNYEMVHSAELIILAEAESVAPIKKDNIDNSSNRPEVRFSVLELIKGSFNKRTIDVYGSAEDYHGKSDAINFSQVRPGAMRGACNAYDYKLGAKFLLFLKNHNGSWLASGNAFSRINEEVSSRNSPWTRAVKRYAQIGKLDDYEKEKAALIALKNQPVEIPGIISDIENHLKTPSMDKSLDDLKEIFEQSSQEEWRRQKALWAITKAHAKSAEPFFEKLLADGKWDEYAGPISANFASNSRRDMLPVLIDLFVKNSAQVNKMKSREDLSNKEKSLLNHKSRNLESTPKLILALADENDTELIFGKLLQTQNRIAIGNIYFWVSEKHPSLKSKFTAELEKMAASGGENIKQLVESIKGWL